MATSNLKTDWKVIGSSGATIDGRNIEKEWLLSMAETYDPKKFTALIWPDHERWWENYGKVEAVRAVENKDGGIDLEAILAPNDSYLYENKYGQKLFTSMEITPDFPEKGQFYLSGLGATDSPASARTSEIRFSANQPGPMVFGETVKIELDIKPEKATWLKKMFGHKPQHNSEDLDMADKAALEKVLEPLTKRLDTIETKLSQHPPAGTGATEEPPKTDIDPAKYSALEKENAELKAKVEALEKNAIDPAKFKELQDEAKALREEFTKALNSEHPGTTKPPANPGGGGDDRKDYL